LGKEKKQKDGGQKGKEKNSWNLKGPKKCGKPQQRGFKKPIKRFRSRRMKKPLKKL